MEGDDRKDAESVEQDDIKENKSENSDTKLKKDQNITKNTTTSSARSATLGDIS